MTRIDEALRRIGMGELGPTSGEQQKHFERAWAVAPDPPSSAGKPPAAGLLPDPPPALRLPRPSEGFDALVAAWQGRLASAAHGDPMLTEQYRRLAATLHHTQLSNGLRSVMVSSADSGDGKTLTAVNLALVLSESYRATVLLVDADLRRPSIPALIDLDEGRGLGDVLRSSAEQKLALSALTPRLSVLPAGPAIENSIEALTSPRMRQIVEEAKSRFDWVILDAPPIGLTADARLLSQLVDGTLFVIRAGKSQCADVQTAIEAIGGDRILGVVLNGVESRPGVGYYYGVGRQD